VNDSSQAATGEALAAATDLVSVIIPCYNQGQFLGEAIESVLGQSYRHFEIIVVDDGSTDKTADVVRRYSAVRYMRQENAGRSAARNAGLGESRGEFVVFLDSDDRLLPHALQTGVACFEEHAECAFVSGRCHIIAADGSVLSMPRQRCVEGDHYGELLRRGSYIWCPATVLYRRRVFDFVHGFDPALVPVEDYDLYLRVTKIFAVHCHGQIVAEYRQHSSNTSRDLAVMQKAALAAHEAQWNNVKANKRLLQAYRAGRHFWQEGYPLQHMIRRIREIVRERLPPDAIVAVATGGHSELLRLDGRQAWHFPLATITGAGDLFAQGADGSIKTPAWIEAGMTYQFSLYRGTQRSNLLAKLLVRGAADPSSIASPERTPQESGQNNGVLLSANPNPVLVGEKPGATTITWSTGDGSEGQLYVLGNYAGPDPSDSADAWRGLQTVQESGAQYLLIPARSFWRLADYKEFRERMERRYPAVFREENACIIFDLREPSR
jgi:glycosyltransferase involved in cell wall biosynthesis